MNDVMVDLETWGSGNNAVVVQIGAVFFNRQTGAMGEKFKCNVQARTAVKHGFDIDADTIYWWLRQDPDAIKSITNGEDKLNITDAFSRFNDFLEPAKCVWSHATFDFVIIQNVMRTLEIKPSFHYRAARDIRTLVDLSGINIKSIKREGVHHDALDDAIFQVKYCVQAMRKMNRQYT